MLVRIARFDPDTQQHWQQEYLIQDGLAGGMTVMDLLAYIQLHLDPTLAFFQHSVCNHGICGRCVLTVDGKPRLACLEPVGDRACLALAPAPWRRLVRDLVTDDRQQDRRAGTGAESLIAF